MAWILCLAILSLWSSVMCIEGTCMHTHSHDYKFNRSVIDSNQHASVCIMQSYVQSGFTTTQQSKAAVKDTCIHVSVMIHAPLRQLQPNRYQLLARMVYHRTTYTIIPCHNLLPAQRRKCNALSHMAIGHHGGTTQH